MPTLDFKERPGDPVLEGWLGDLYGTELGFAGRQAKSTLKNLNSGKDVSSLGYFNSIAQRHASNRRDIGDNYGYGGNALIASAGGEQANILNRMKDTALAHDYERQGNETVDAVANLRDSATNTFENARNTRLNAEQAAIAGRSNYWQNRYVPYQKQTGFDKLLGLGDMVAKMGEAASGFYKPKQP